MYGTYFNGAYLAYLIPREEGFRDVFATLLPDHEFQSVMESSRSGPYRLYSVPGLIASNATYVLELLASLMLLTAWRRAGVVIALGVVIGIEVGARELMFGVLLINLLALYGSIRVVKYTAVASALLYVCLVAFWVGDFN